jgi:hypothetical protein
VCVGGVPGRDVWCDGVRDCQAARLASAPMAPTAPSGHASAQQPTPTPTRPRARAHAHTHTHKHTRTRAHTHTHALARARAPLYWLPGSASRSRTVSSGCVSAVALMPAHAPAASRRDTLSSPWSSASDVCEVCEVCEGSDAGAVRVPLVALAGYTPHHNRAQTHDAVACTRCGLTHTHTHTRARARALSLSHTHTHAPLSASCA